MVIKRHYFVIAILLFLYLPCFSQVGEDIETEVKSRKYFNDLLVENGITYKKPIGYVEVFNMFDSARLGNSNLGTPALQLTGRDSSIHIFVSILKIDTSEALRIKLKKFGYDFNANKGYIANYKSTGDQLIQKKLLSVDNTKEKFNADQSGIFDVVIWKRNELRGIYNKCKCFFIHKENRADIYIYYFYTEKGEKNLHKEIEKTDEMFRFLN